MESNKKNKEFRKLLNNEIPKKIIKETKIEIVLEDCGGWEDLFPEPTEVVVPPLMITEAIKKYWKQITKL